MAQVDRTKLDGFLSGIAAALDIPAFVYEDAILKYDDIAAWLSAEDSDLTSLTPEVYPQGSFRIGTVVRPVGEKGEFDIDLVCLLHLAKEQTSQSELKRRVGERLAKRRDLAKRLEEKRRCWTIHFTGDKAIPDFHLDVLPAIPNPSVPPTGILITDKDMVRWQESHPIGYSEWFFSRMREVFAQRRLAVAKSLELAVEEVPHWRIRTPLQIAIQLLKRHRDLYFGSKLSARPSSVLVTTLSAHSYGGQATVYDTIVGISERMSSFLEKKGDKWWLPNPVDAKENFADGWNDDESLPEEFRRWAGRLRKDIAQLDAQPSIEAIALVLGSVLGQSPVYAAANLLGPRTASSVPRLFLSEPLVPELAESSHTLPPPWPLQLAYRSQISGSVHFSKATKKLWGHSGKAVPKKVWLRFSVATDAPSPYTVKWQVVNTGAEALAAKGLRGGFYDSEPLGSAVRWETTSYLGTHWIEAFIIKDGVCVSRSSRRAVRVR